MNLICIKVDSSLTILNLSLTLLKEIRMEICNERYRLINVEKYKYLSVSFYTLRFNIEERDAYKFLVQKILNQISRDYLKRK